MNATRRYLNSDRRNSSPYHHEFAPADVGKKAWWVVVWTDGATTSAPSEAFGATITG